MSTGSHATVPAAAAQLEAAPVAVGAEPPAVAAPLLGRRHRVAWRDVIRRRMLAAADAVVMVFAFTVLAVAGHGPPDRPLWIIVLAPVWIISAKLHGLYDRDHRVLRHLTADEVPSIATWAVASVGVSYVIFSFVPDNNRLSATDVFGLWLSAIPAALAARAGVRWLWRRITPRERALLVGGGPLLDAVQRKLELFRDIHVDPVGHLPLDGKQIDDALTGDLARIRSEVGVERIILAAVTIDEATIAQLVRFCREYHLKLSVVPPARGMFGTAGEIAHIADLPVIEYNTWDVSRSTMAIKRVIDVIVAFVALLVTLPLLAVIAVAVKLDSRGPVFFVQDRAGWRGRPFRLLKFRTMVRDAEEILPQVVTLDALDEPVFKLRNDPRVTRVGRVLRRLSLDELPQLVNVLRGDMSLVGPRPEQCNLADRYDAEQRIRLSVKPGLTGPMQVFGRGELRLDERLAVEREYIENLSLSRDFRILLMTAAAVFGARGAF